MKIAMTGHTNGIGKAIYDDLIATNDITGFSLTTGHDISSEAARASIIQESMECSVFINNAYDYSKNNESQCLMTEELFEAWRGQEKFIINIGSRINDFKIFESGYKATYAKQKKRLDDFYLDHSHEKPYIITVRPGSTDTRVLKRETVEKLNPEDVAKVIRFILENKNNFLVRTITLGKL